MALPNISQHEKHLLTHAVACMAADSKKAKHCYDKLTSNFVIPITIPQNKLNTLKQNKHRQSQHPSVHNGPQNTSQPTVLNETIPYNIKLKSTMDHISSCNENKKEIIQTNKLKSFKFEKNQKHCGMKSKKVHDVALLLKQGPFKLLRPKEELQPEALKSEMYSLIHNQNIDKINNVNQNKSINIKPELLHVLAIPKNIKKINTEEKIISTDPIVNFMNTKLTTISVSPQLANVANKCVEEKDNLPNKSNYTVKQYNTTENVSNSQKTSLSSGNLENIFTSNIIRMVNEMKNRKRRLIATSDPTRNQSEHIFEITTKAINFSSNNNEHFDLFKMKSAKTGNETLTINKNDGKSISNTNFIISNDTKTSGKKYSLQTNQPHWILHSTLFKSEKYQSSKRPILSRYVSSESHDNKIKNEQLGEINCEEEIRKVGSLPQSQTNTNQLQDPSWPRCISSQFLENDIKNKECIKSDLDNKKKIATSLSKSQQNIIRPFDTFSSRYKSSESFHNEVKNKAFVGFNSDEKTKQITSLAEIQTKLNKQDESLLSPDASLKPKNEGAKNDVFEAFNSKDKFREVNLLPKTKTKFNGPNKAMATPSESDEYVSTIPSPKFRSVKNYNKQQINYLKSKGSSDSVFENVLQKQKNSIASGHKYASFKSERSEDSFFVVQRKLVDFEMLDRLFPHKNKRYDPQKLHLLTNNSKESKFPKNRIKTSGVDDIHHKNNNAKQTNKNSTVISNKQIPETTEKNTNNEIRDEFTTGDKKNVWTRKEEDNEKHEYKEIMENNFEKGVNSETLNISNNQVTSIPFICKQNDAIDNKEPRSEIIMSDISDYHSSKPHGNGSCENSSNPSIISKYIRQRSKPDSETNTELIKKEESSLEHKISKERENV